MSIAEITNEKELLAAINQALQLQSHRLDNITVRVKTLEVKMDQQITLNSRDRLKLRNAVKARVKELTGERYNELRAQYYAWIYGELQDRLKVSSYHDIPAKELDAALHIVRNYTPVRAVPAKVV